MRTDIFDATIREQLQAGKTNAAAGTTPNQAVSIKTTAPESSTLTTLRNQDEAELEMASAAAREKQLRNQTAAVFNGNTDLASKLNTEPQRESSADSSWCNCENCQNA